MEKELLKWKTEVESDINSLNENSKNANSDEDFNRLMTVIGIKETVLERINKIIG